MTDFCKMRGLERKLVCFLYNGRDLFETDTPKSVGLKEGDKILIVLTGKEVAFLCISTDSNNVFLNHESVYAHDVVIPYML